jgi:transcriptional regulator with XRE-family HTH domain
VTSSELLNLPLSELIKTARKANNLTQNDFGKFFEPSIAQPTIARWEKGDLLPDRKHFPKIASLLNLTLEELLNLVQVQLKEDANTSCESEEETYIYDSRHLKVLNKGSKLWNHWREKNPNVAPQLEGAKPKENYLDGIDLNGAYLRKTYLKGKSLKRAIFHGADLREANLSYSDLSNADLCFANLNKANLTGTDLSDANLWGADLSEAILKSAILCRANLKEANLGYADLTYVDMREANLNEANFEYAILKYCFVYGISDWNINLNGAVQKQLSICQYRTQSIYVDCIENVRLKLLEINSRDLPEIHKCVNKLQTAISENRASFKQKLKDYTNERELKMKLEMEFIPGEINH